MNHPTYKEQFDKVTQAYIDGTLKRSNPCACFIGNILNNTISWAYDRTLNCDYFPSEYYAYNPFKLDRVYSFYTSQELVEMENNFMNHHHPNDEECLFIAMESTLEMLKQIHIKKGEIIDDAPVFEKRKLQLI